MDIFILIFAWSSSTEKMDPLQMDEVSSLLLSLEDDH